MYKSLKNLVEKYKTYNHGERKKDQHIVLDSNLISGIKNNPNICIFKQKYLLQDFLKIF